MPSEEPLFKSSPQRQQDPADPAPSERDSKEERGPAWARAAHEDPEDTAPGDLELLGSFVSSLTGEIARNFPARAVKRLGLTALRGGRAFLRPENLERVAEAGRSLRDAREVAGWTLQELSEALELQDEGLLDAVEKGTATLSFELILRLSSLLARHDPVPFAMRYLRTYDPVLWQFLHDWGLGRLPLAYERERRFINIYRKRDAARALSEEAFNHLIDFTDGAFALALEELSQRRELERELTELRRARERDRAELHRLRVALHHTQTRPAPTETSDKPSSRE